MNIVILPCHKRFKIEIKILELNKIYCNCLTTCSRQCHSGLWWFEVNRGPVVSPLDFRSPCDNHIHLISPDCSPTFIDHIRKLGGLKHCSNLILDWTSPARELSSELRGMRHHSSHIPDCSPGHYQPCLCKPGGLTYWLCYLFRPVTSTMNTKAFRQCENCNTYRIQS